MKKLSFIFGIIAGLIIVLSGILTALKITPQIAAVGLEVSLGIWRIFAGIMILVFVFISRKNRPMNWIVIAFGAFEILVYLIEKDYTVLFTAPFIAIISGIFGLIKK